VDKETESDDDGYEGFAFLQKDVLCSIQDNWQFQKAGYDWTASPQWWYSETQYFLAILRCETHLKFVLQFW